MKKIYFCFFSRCMLYMQATQHQSLHAKYASDSTIVNCMLCIQQFQFQSPHTMYASNSTIVAACYVFKRLNTSHRMLCIQVTQHLEMPWCRLTSTNVSQSSKTCLPSSYFRLQYIHHYTLLSLSVETLRKSYVS